MQIAEPPLSESGGTGEATTANNSNSSNKAGPQGGKRRRKGRWGGELEEPNLDPSSLLDSMTAVAVAAAATTPFTGAERASEQRVTRARFIPGQRWR
jgi:hypothetical protein